METESHSRKLLGVIAFTDAVEFSKRMGLDEEGTLKLLGEHFSVIKKLCADRGGRIIKNTGDGLMVFFENASEAMRWALAVRDFAMHQSSAKTPDETLRHRIGLHLDDVVVGETDIMGDGVNVAARLVTVADPNGIAMSQVFYALVSNQVQFEAHHIGTPALKGIPHSVSVYVVAGEGSERDTSRLGVEHKVEHEQTNLPVQPTIKANPHLAELTIERVKEEIVKPGSVLCLTKCVDLLRKLTDESNPAGIGEITEAILRDSFLTAKVMVIANSSHFNRTRKQITTVSQAVLLLGLGEVRAIALSVLLLEQLPNQARASLIRNRSVSSVFGGSLSRTVAKKAKTGQVEMAFLAGAFCQFGKLLAYSFLPDQVIQHETLVRDGMSEEEACNQVFGMRFGVLGKRIGEFLSLPPSITCYMDAFSDEVNQSEDANAGVLDITRFSSEVCRLSEVAETIEDIEDGIKRSPYLKNTSLPPINLREAIVGAVQDLESYQQLTEVDMPLWKKIKTIHVKTRQRQEPASANVEEPAFGKKTTRIAIDRKNASCLEVFQDGLVTVNSLIASKQPLRTILSAICETVYFGFKARNVVMATKNDSRNALVADVGIGPNTDDLEKTLRISLVDNVPLLPNIALNTGKDIYIDNIKTHKLAPTIPLWIKTLDPQSILLLPVNWDQSRVALIYVDGQAFLPEGKISDDISAELRKLKNLAVLQLGMSGKD